MGREEQIEERDVLDSIYPDEITDLSETSYRVSIALDAPGHNEDTEAPILLLTVSYPPDYPDIAPDLSLTLPPNAPKYPYLTLPDDAPHLLSSLTDVISESLGQAMIFTIISTLKENAETLITERQAAIQAEEDKDRARAEEAENAKFHGEAVTRESFMAWRMRFREEMEKIEEEKRKEEEEHMGRKEMARSKEVKLTGKQLWEQGLVGKVDEAEGDAEDERDALLGVERLRVGD